MSGDVQPRKRKDKKKKKDDGDPIPEKLHVPIFTNNTITEDVNIHVHKDEGTGGGICAKFVFFILFSALAVLIGLIITEHKGLTDIDTVDPNSKFAQIFEGWVDTNSDTHDDHEIEDGSLEDDDHEEHDHEEDDHYQEEDDHDQEEDDLEEDDQEEDDQEEDDQIDAQDEDDHEDNLSEEVDENVQYSEEDDDDEDEELDDNEENEQEEDDANDYDDEDNPYTNKNVAASEEENPEEQDEDDDKEDDEQDEETDKYEDEQQLDQEDHNDDEDEEENDKDDEEDDIDQNQEDDKDEDDKDEDDIMESKEKRYISKEKLDDQDGEGDNDDANKDDEDANDDVEDNNQKSAEKDDKPEEDVEDDQKLNKEEEDDIKEKNAEKPEAEAEEEFKDGVLENSNMAVKLGVGVALLVVAHLVLVKKWRTVSNDEDHANDTPSVPNLQDRRNTIIVPPSFKEVEPDMEHVKEEYSEEEDDSVEDEKPDTNIAQMKYQELTTAYTQPKSKYDVEKSQKMYEYEDDEEIDDDIEPEEEELEEEEEDDEEAEADFDEGDGEEYDDEEDEDEELLKRLEARYGKLKKDKEGKIADKSEPDSDDDNDYTNITNEDEYKIKQQIDEAQNSIKKNTTYAIALFDKLLQKFPSSPRSLYGKALALDHLAEIKRSNEILQKALQLYERVLKTEKVPVALFHLAVNRCINRWRFLGQYKKAILIHELVIEQFPDSPKHLNSLAVTYLIINRIEDARTIFKQVLMKWPEDGVALVHYGFILKTADNELEKAVRYLQKGLHTKDEGVLDGRFYFHLGDALVRLGRSDEALKIYEEGTKNKLFLSKYQRSLYNVPRLSAKSWWSPKDLPFSNSLKLLTESWTKIKDEGLAVLNEKGTYK